MLKDEIKKKINHKQKGSKEKKRKLNNKEQIKKKKKTNQRMDNFGFKG